MDHSHINGQANINALVSSSPELTQRPEGTGVWYRRDRMSQQWSRIYTLRRITDGGTSDFLDDGSKEDGTPNLYRAMLISALGKRTRPGSDGGQQPVWVADDNSMGAVMGLHNVAIPIQTMSPAMVETMKLYAKQREGIRGEAEDHFEAKAKTKKVRKKRATKKVLLDVEELS